MPPQEGNIFYKKGKGGRGEETEHRVLFLETKAAICSKNFFFRFLAWNQRSSSSINFCNKQDLIRNDYLAYYENMSHKHTIHVIMYKTSTGVWQWPYNWKSNSTSQSIASGVASCRKFYNQECIYVRGCCIYSDYKIGWFPKKWGGGSSRKGKWDN